MGRIDFINDEQYTLANCLTKLFLKVLESGNSNNIRENLFAYKAFKNAVFRKNPNFSSKEIQTYYDVVINFLELLADDLTDMKESYIDPENDFTRITKVSQLAKKLKVSNHLIEKEIEQGRLIAEKKYYDKNKIRETYILTPQAIRDWKSKYPESYNLLYDLEYKKDNRGKYSKKTEL